MMKKCFLSLALCVATCTVFAGEIVRDTILGTPCCVYLPATYSERVAAASDRYPCLYLQHGMYGCENDWVVSGHLLSIMDSLLQEEAVKEMVVIMPDNFLGSIPAEKRQAFMESPAVNPTGEPFDLSDGRGHYRRLTPDEERAYEMSGYWETHFPDFMGEVERKYYVNPSTKYRAIAGLSMGGFHTMHVNHFMVGTFEYVGLFSAVILPLQNYKELYAHDLNGWDKQVKYGTPAYDHWMEEMQTQAQMPPLYWIGIGRTDFLYAQMQDYRKWLERHNYEYTYYESDGGHTWPNWRDYLTRFLKLCFTHN